MKKILILCVALAILVAFLAPIVAEATVTAGTANPYHLKTIGINKRVAVVAGTTRPWTDKTGIAAQRDSTDYCLLVTAATDPSHPETTSCFDASRMVYPAAGQIYGVITSRAATADSFTVIPQVSQDKLYWTSMATVTCVGTLDTDALVEASTTITTPSWQWMRFIVTNAEKDKAGGCVSTAGVRIWFSYYEKD
jgi:hypothetical protein